MAPCRRPRAPACVPASRSLPRWPDFAPAATRWRWTRARPSTTTSSTPGRSAKVCSVQAIAQDHQGYIWVGTQSGPARFDGIRFTAFKPETTPALPGVWTRSLLVDRGGRVWIGTYKGLAVYEDGVFRRIAIADAAHYPVLDVFAMVEDADGITAATGSGVFDVRDQRLVRRTGSPSAAQSLLKRDDGLWVGGLGGVFRLQRGQSQFMPLPVEAANAAVTRLVEAQGRIWAGTSAGLYLRDGDSWRLATDTPGLQHSPITTLLEDRSHNLWVGSNAGLARIRDSVVVEFVPDGSPGSFRGVMSAFQDREGNLWLGSQWEGVARIWNGWTRRYSSVEGLQERIVWSVSRAPDGRIWVGTNDGLSVLDHGRYTQVLRGDQLPHPHAYNLLAEADQIWIGTRRGLVVWREGKLEAPPLFAPMASAQINGIVRDSHGVVWFPTTDGLFRLENQRLVRYGQAQGLKDVRVRQVRELRDGRFLVASQAGLFVLEGDRLREIGLDAGLPPGLDVTATFELRGGEWAIGTLSERVYLFDGKRWHLFGDEQGFPANAPFFITEDRAGNLWVAGIRGITRAPLSEMRAVARAGRGRVHAEMVLNERGDRLSGQQGYCCNGAGNGKGFLHDEVLWLPTRDGVVAFDTRGVVKNKVAPEVVIERMQAGEHWRDVSHSAHLELPSDSRDLAFEFTALSFQDPASVLLRYRLVGYDRNWRDLNVVSPRSVNYTNLPPGVYSFEVRAANNAGVWNPKSAKLAFGIKPWFHETGVFYALLAALALTILYAAWRQQRLAHLHQRAQLEQQVAERTQELHSANVQLEHASQTDPLTGLRNRRYLANQLPVDLAFYVREQARSGDAEQALLFALVDIDNFQRINAEHGHRAGDRVLQQFAQLMTRMVRTGDYVVHWGGEKFLLVFRPMPKRNAQMLGERIRRGVEGHVFDVGGEGPVALSCSIGLAEYTLAHEDGSLGWEQTIELADAALYWIKQHGRDGWAQLLPATPVQLPPLLGRLQSETSALIASGQLHLLSSRTPPPPG
ncbi:MAG: two-component regulator propeller domain-containing protein [Arenimonas sp.]